MQWLLHNAFWIAYRASTAWRLGAGALASAALSRLYKISWACEMLITSFEFQSWYSKSRLLEYVLWSTCVVISSFDGFVQYPPYFHCIESDQRWKPRPMNRYLLLGPRVPLCLGARVSEIWGFNKGCESVPVPMGIYTCCLYFRPDFRIFIFCSQLAVMAQEARILFRMMG